MTEPRREPFPHETNHDPKSPNRNVRELVERGRRAKKDAGGKTRPETPARPPR